MFKIGSKLSSQLVKSPLLSKRLVNLQGSLTHKESHLIQPLRGNIHHSAYLNQLSRVPLSGKESKGKQGQGNVQNDSIEFTAGKAVVLFLLTGGITYYLFEREKRKMAVRRQQEENKGYGKPQIGGGKFKLVDHNGQPFTEQNLLGKFSLIYFGFSHCPDICPDELDKLGCWLDDLESEGIKPQPIFITCDPARDTPDVLKEYLKDFHDGIIGLTGSFDDVKKVCKQYRVYFSTPPEVKPGQDYLVDHSIFFYLMDPEGEFVDALGLNFNNKTGSERIKEHIKQYEEEKSNRSKSKKSWW